MRTKFLMLTALLALTGFAVSAQVLSVASVERLAIPQGEATEQVAAISADGTYLLLTSGAQTGLVKLASGSFQEWTVKLGSFDMWHHPRGYVSNFLMRPASS